ncbi:MAG: hypothetical protein EXR29_14470 [Betaproteobacteria bacterium]|nr:hypothetical protein [Betaproteobacteria bacterium]
MISATRHSSLVTLFGHPRTRRPRRGSRVRAELSQQADTHRHFTRRRRQRFPGAPHRAGPYGPLGQQLVVDNRPTVFLAEIVAKAPPDGYTLLVTGSTHWITPLLEKTAYDPIKDFALITLVDRSPSVLVVHPSMPLKSTRQLIALAGRDQFFGGWTGHLEFSRRDIVQLHGRREHGAHSVQGHGPGTACRDDRRGSRDVRLRGRSGAAREVGPPARARSGQPSAFRIGAWGSHARRCGLAGFCFGSAACLVCAGWNASGNRHPAERGGRALSPVRRGQGSVFESRNRYRPGHARRTAGGHEIGNSERRQGAQGRGYRRAEVGV